MLRLFALLVQEIILCVFYIITLIPLGRMKVLKGKKEVPIVLLHGWLTRSFFLVLLKKRLEHLVYSVHMPDFGGHTGKIDRSSRELHLYIERNGLKKIIFIGYSLGGLIGLHYYFNHKKNIVKFISLGTPFNGTYCAKLTSFFSESAKQMAPGSSFLIKLSKKKIHSHSFYTIGSNHDYIVPYWSSQLKGAHHINIKYEGHLSLVFSRKVFNKIKEIIYFYR